MPNPIDLQNERASRARREAELVRAEILAKCITSVEAMGDDVAGFAFVIWSKTGEMRTAYDASKGPIGPALLPTLVSDALNRHVAVMLARDSEMDDTSTS